jgi:hypothetical protein
MQRLYLQLEAPDRSLRDAAERALIELGPDVLAKLPTVDDNTAAETKERLARIRQVLEQSAADRITQPSRLTLKGSYAVTEILGEIEKQTGNRIVDVRAQMGQPASDQTIEVDFQDAEFWPAFDQVLDQAGLTTYEFTGEPRTLGVVMRGNTGSRSERAVYRGVFRMEPVEVFAQKNLRATQDGALRVRMNVMWEPRVAPIVVRQAYSDLAVATDDGSTIEISMPQAAAEVPVQNTVAGIDLTLPMSLPQRSARAIESLTGKLMVTIPGREESFEFTDLVNARNVSQSKAGVRVTLERTRKNGSVHEFRVRLELLDPNDSFQSHMNWAANNTVQLIGPGDQVIDNPNFEQYLERQREVGFAYLFPLDGDPAGYRLVYRTPVAILNVPVEYELKNIPLP